MTDKPDVIWNLPPNQKYPSKSQVAEVIRIAGRMVKNTELSMEVIDMADRVEDEWDD
jgi:hypothetical protein